MDKTIYIYEPAPLNPPTPPGLTKPTNSERHTPPLRTRARSTRCHRRWLLVVFGVFGVFGDLGVFHQEIVGLLRAAATLLNVCDRIVNVLGATGDLGAGRECERGPRSYCCAGNAGTYADRLKVAWDHGYGRCRSPGGYESCGRLLQAREVGQNDWQIDFRYEKDPCNPKSREARYHVIRTFDTRGDSLRVTYVIAFADTERSAKPSIIRRSISKSISSRSENISSILVTTSRPVCRPEGTGGRLMTSE